MARVQQHGATRQRMPLADRPFKSRDRRAAHGNGTTFSAVAPRSGPHWPPVDPITREWYRPQARIDGRLTFQPAARFRPSVDSHSHRPEAWRICHIPEPKCRRSFKNLHMRGGTSSCSGTILAAIFRSSAKSGNAGRGGAHLYEAVGGVLVHTGVRSMCAGITALAIGVALDSVGRHVAGAATAGLRTESALLSVFETVRPKSLDHRASLLRVASLTAAFAGESAVEKSEPPASTSGHAS